MVNWRVRFKNWVWVSGFISQIMIVIQLLLVGASSLGLTTFLLTEDIQGWVLALANGIFICLSMLGIVQDPTVNGVGDSKRALVRNAPLDKDRELL